MPKTERKNFLLDFEKPLCELESRIEQIRQLAAENQVDVSGEIAQLEARASTLRKEIFGRRAFLPLDQSGDGALDRSDLTVFLRMALSQLPNDTHGCSVVFCDGSLPYVG